MTEHTPIHIDRTGKLDLDIKNESCIKIKISTWQEMIKIMNRNLNTTTQQTQNNNHEDYPNADHKMISLKQSPK